MILFDKFHIVGGKKRKGKSHIMHKLWNTFLTVPVTGKMIMHHWMLGWKLFFKNEQKGEKKRTRSRRKEKLNNL